MSDTSRHLVTTLRPVEATDAEYLRQLRNRDEVRAVSMQTEVISEATHREWMTRQLSDLGERILFWIIVTEAHHAGYLRLVRQNEHDWLLSIALEPSYRAQGIGTEAIEQACRLLRQRDAASLLLAEVASTNGPAMSCFLNLGFRYQGKKRTDQRLFLQLARMP